MPPRLHAERQRTCRLCRQTRPYPEQFAAGRTCRECRAETKRRGRKAHPDRDTRNRALRAAHLRKHYGISVEFYDMMLVAQEGKCAICRKPETIRLHDADRPHSLAVDHCHKTGRIRGLLCTRCNTGIARFGESVGSLTRAIDYLRHGNPTDEPENAVDGEHGPMYAS